VRLVALALLAIALRAETPINRWTRRLTNYAACGLSAIDGYQTANNVGRFGIIETNPVFARDGGRRVDIPVLIMVKSATCMVPAIMGERVPDKQRLFIEGLNIASAPYYGFVVLHNRSVLDSGIRR
jgi:hypothetical protein